MGIQAIPALRPDSAAFELRHDWTRDEVAEIYRTPLTELVFRAQTEHRKSHAPDRVQTCQLISIKTGGCPEDCAYCPQSAHYDAPVERQGLLDAAACDRRSARRGRARRDAILYGGGVAAKLPEGAEFERVLEMAVRGVSRHSGMEVCCTPWVWLERRTSGAPESCRAHRL